MQVFRCGERESAGGRSFVEEVVVSDVVTDRSISFDVPSEGVLSVTMEGRWTGLPGDGEADEILKQVADSTELVECNGSGIDDWDSTFLVLVRALRCRCEDRGVELSIDGLPGGVCRLLELAEAGRERADDGRVRKQEGFLAYIGNRATDFVRSAGEMLAFVGASVLSLGRLLRGRAVFRGVDLGLHLQETGAYALPIVSLISVLVGMIMAFVGAYQLRMFGAEIYIAAGVALGMVREMGPIMTGILLAGRTGAAFAAQIGTMQVNEEVDALETMGISAFDFLVLPRMIAMTLMMPMLCLYSDLMGIAGGAVVASGMFGIPLAQYFEQTWSTVGVADFGIGVSKSVLFGLAVAAAGCMRGMQCGRSASAVGRAATSAVVTGIVAVIVIDSLAAVVSTVVGL